MEVWQQETLQKLISLPKIDESSILIPNDLDIISIIESLQPFMIHSDPGIRGKAAVIFKVAVFQKFDSLDSESLKLLKNFCEQKLEDAAVLIEALTVLNLFYKNAILNSIDVLHISIKALKLIKSSRFGVENRHEIFKFVHEYLKGISSIPEEDSDLFYESFLTAIDSEKDPRNLMIIFNTINCISKFPLSNDYIEEFFESVFCYFPITFRSNPSDPTLITVEELKESLKRVISGDSRFGDLAVSVLIDKMASTSSSAKFDSLDVLLAAVPVYHPTSFAQYRYQLEVALFSEITGNPDTKIQSKALQLIRLLCARLPEEEAQNWMNKFLREAISSIELDSREIMSKAAVLIESVASSSENGFKFALEMCANFLIQKCEAHNTVKGQVARNCLVALLSPLKINPQWIENIKSVDDLNSNLNSLFSDINCEIDSYGVYLVLFSFVSPILSLESIQTFVSKFLSICSSETLPTNELKNCIWLASKSCPNAFKNHLISLDNSEIIAASASNSELTKVSLLRLIELDRISAIEEVLLKSDLSLVIEDFDLVKLLLNLPLNPVSIVKLVSKCDLNSQICLIKQKLKLELVLISSRPAAIEQCKQEITEELAKFKNPNTITSLFNKCPNIWDLQSFKDPELILAGIKGLIYRMDPKSLNLLKENLDNSSKNVPIEIYAKMFSEPSTNELFSSTETFHIKKSLYLQWILKFLLETGNLNQQCKTYSAVLISVISVAPVTLIDLNSEILIEIVSQFLEKEADFDVQVLQKCWMILNDLIAKCQLNVDVSRFINLALKHCSIKTESFSVIRYFSLKLLSNLIENKFIRSGCFEFQDFVLSKLKLAGVLDDPKRSVRQEAAKANNLWIILKEEGVLS